MTVIQLNRKTNTVVVGANTEDIEHFANISLYHNITHVARASTIGNWYHLCNHKHSILGFVTGVEYIKEKW